MIRSGGAMRGHNKCVEMYLNTGMKLVWSNVCVDKEKDGNEWVQWFD